MKVALWAWMGERHQCQMFAGRTLPGVSESKKKVERKHGKGNSLLCQEGARERDNEEREMGKSIYSDAQLPLIIWTTTTPA